MKISEVLEKLDGTVHVASGIERNIERGIVGDLLSFVMGSAPDGAVWVTIQNHANVAAVALLKEIPLVILSSGRSPSAELQEHCAREGICLASVEPDSFEVCGRLYEMGISGASRA